MTETLIDKPIPYTRTTTTPAPPPSKTERFRYAQRAARRHPLAGHAAPWPVTALLWAGAAAGHAGSGDTALFVAGAALVLAVVAWWVWSRRRTRAERRARRWHVLTVMLASQLWMLWALQSGAGGMRAVSLWVGMYLLMAPYWRRRQIPIPPEGFMALGDEYTVPGEGHPVLWKWTDRVQVKGGPLPKAYLTDPEPVKNGEAWTINLVPGVQTTMTAINAHPLIVSALDHLTVDQVIVDRHPSGSMARAKLTVVKGHPLNKRLDHPGPEAVLAEYHETGYVYMGMHPDEDPGRWGFFIPGWGLAGGFLVGTIGSGKSTIMLNLATAACHTGHLTVWAADPQHGQSFPELLKHASWAADNADEIMLQLDASVALIAFRGLLNSIRGRNLHIPTKKEPGVLLFLDEFHKMTKDLDNPKRAQRATGMLSLIAREGRKAAVAIVGADQDFDLAGVFGNDDTLRTSLRAKNLWVGRVPSKQVGGMITDLQVDPSQLPEQFPDGSSTSGLGFLIGKRTAPSRGWFPAGAEEMLAAAPKRDLEKAGAKVVGASYLTRHDRARQSKALDIAHLGAMDPDLIEELLDANPELRDVVEELVGGVDMAAALAALTQRQTGGPGEGAAEPERTTSDDWGFGGDMPPWPTFDYNPPEPEKQTALDVIHGLVREGVRKKQELMRRSGYADTTVRNALDELMARGDVVKARHGEYEPASSTVAA
jgi:hypothetical protein